MSDADWLALGERATRCSGWRTLPGMLRMDGTRVVAVDEPVPCDGVVWEPGGERDVGALVYATMTVPPDLRDDATKGCLLALVRQAWEGRAFVSVIHPVAESMGEPWGARVVDYRGDYLVRGLGGTTEGEALVAALEASDR